MLRSLHMKLVLIMVLLIVSLMTVVGAFLINSVSSFYLHDFYEQMALVFSQGNDLALDLRAQAAEGQSDEEFIQGVLEAYVGDMGVDRRNRNYYILDGQTAKYLAGSDDVEGPTLNLTNNITYAMNHPDDKTGGNKSDPSADYMDVAVPFQRGESRYIIYVRDNRVTMRDLNSELFMLILEALIFGLIISVLLSFLLSKTMITPIERLTAGAERVAKGDFSYKIEVASRDEIGVLTGTFNNMARQLQDTLREVGNERNKLGTLFLHMTDGVVAFDRDGRLVQSNPAAERMLGRSLAVDSEGIGYDVLFGDIATLPAVLTVEQQGYLGGMRETGGRILELLLAPISGETALGVMVVIHDVTEQRRTEEMRREFVANVSHELRTPLTNIRSYAETLVDNAGNLPEDTEKNFLGVILNESDRMTHIVQDLLTLSRFDSGRDELRLELFSFEEAIRSVYNAVLLDAQRHGHAVRLDLPAGLPDIRGDRERLVQVMMNVMANAIKYTPDGGKIEVSAGQGRGRVWMEVADNGMGIPPEDRPRIFERFYRVDKARSRESGGTGLGLSIAKEIVERHEGTIRLVDKKGPGLTVRIEMKIKGPDHGD
ncbi:ATPase/histidine kinase/DNA gyrase B/HSP90 domain protein [uncultured Eubacteriales bacterium]|uniref:histidine kinase n=1 Tax=uncultured Eubacteriales bacterium TaxID=172733 RepID=A0A212J1N1_9FIRM|nr:ATPase/histidine kinase/DNA gyrase B/HSP90 domain protein [uncultured Eubacteriales bacterium]